MTRQTNIFITGATGYIGGGILAYLLAHNDRAAFQITALLRDADKARKLEVQFGVKAVVGSTTDVDKVANLAAAADVVFDTSDCDDLAATKAILSGMKRRYELTGTTAALIHTSGAGEFFDDAVGEAREGPVYSDLNIPLIETLPDTAMHREVDLAVVAADKEGYVRTYIVLPALVYGVAKNPLVEAGIAKAHCKAVVQIGIKQAISSGEVGQIGEGLNVWANVDINDLPDLYILLFNALLVNPENVAHGREGYYIAESDEFSYRDLKKEIGRVLFKLGKIAKAEPRAYSEAEIATLGIWSTVTGVNLRCKGERSRALGWKPVKRTKDMLESIEYEAKVIVSAAA